jgi:hypothetical protein
VSSFLFGLTIAAIFLTVLRISLQNLERLLHPLLTRSPSLGPTRALKEFLSISAARMLFLKRMKMRHQVRVQMLQVRETLMLMVMVRVRVRMRVRYWLRV